MKQPAKKSIFPLYFIILLILRFTTEIMLRLQNGVNQLIVHHYYGFTGITITKIENNPPTWNLQFTEKITKLSFLLSPKKYLLKVFLLLRKNIMHLLMHMKYLPWIKRTTSRQPVLKLNGHNHLITKVIKIVHPTTVFSYYIPKLFKETSKWIINLRIYHLHKYTGWSNKKR